MNELKIVKIIPGNFSVLLFLAVNDRSDWISLDADSKSMPLVIGQTRAKFDNLSFASLDALANSWEFLKFVKTHIPIADDIWNSPRQLYLVVELNPTSDLEGHDLLAFQVVDGKEHLLRLAFGSECGKNGKVGGKSIGKEVSSWDAGNLCTKKSWFNSRIMPNAMPIVFWRKKLRAWIAKDLAAYIFQHRAHTSQFPRNFFLVKTQEAIQKLKKFTIFSTSSFSEMATLLFML